MTLKRRLLITSICVASTAVGTAAGAAIVLIIWAIAGGEGWPPPTAEQPLVWQVRSSDLVVVFTGLVGLTTTWALISQWALDTRERYKGRHSSHR